MAGFEFKSSMMLWRSLFIHLLLSAPTTSSAIGGVKDEVTEMKSHRITYSKETRIIGGSLAAADRYPYLVSMFANDKFGCAGTLIGKDTVLTAAHCLRSTITVGIGSDNRDAGERVGIRKFVKHPKYNANTDEYDIGLLFLENSTTLDNSISLPSLNNDGSFPAPGSSAHVMGWGDTDEGTNIRTSEELMMADLQVISNEDCKEAKGEDVSYKNWIYDDMLCTDTEGKDACQGDSGGPLIIQNDNPESDIIVGIVSWGIGCASLPGVFSRLSMTYDWIQETVCEESNNPTESLCAEATNPPSLGPSKRPTSSPTISPTTAEPTASPTETPTKTPTSVPSLSSEPTSIPSAYPTSSLQPSSSPSQFPSTTKYPSTQPSTAPSRSPSNSPTMTASPSMARIHTQQLKEDRTVAKDSQLTPDASISPNEEGEVVNSSIIIDRNGVIYAVLIRIFWMWVILWFVLLELK